MRSSAATIAALLAAGTLIASASTATAAKSQAHSDAAIGFIPSFPQSRMTTFPSLRERPLSAHRSHGMRSCAFAVAIPLFGIGPTLAADLPPANPISPPAIAWTGSYGGLQLGGAWDESSWRLFSQTGSGFLYGGQIGFNYQIDQFVLGAEGDVSGSTLKADSICAQPPERIAGRPWIISPHYAREWERQ
jgi:opacity protein-like surface antigen